MTFQSIWILFFAKTGKFQVQPGLENFPQGGPGPPAWGTYDMQRAQGHRISVKQSYNWYLGLQLVQGFKSYLLMNVMGICLLDGP